MFSVRTAGILPSQIFLSNKNLDFHLEIFMERQPEIPYNPPARGAIIPRSMEMTEFETACRARVGQLRTAFIELYDSIGADPGSPQDVARKLRLNKTLTWNVARLLQAADELAAVSHVPGSSSLEKVIQATARHGAEASLVAKARDAVRDFHTMIEAHAGDRATLDLIIDGSGDEANGRLELSRKLAFRGNSGLYGVQARTRVVCNFLAPHPSDPERLDMATISGYVGFRRLRPGVRWPIFMVRAWSQGQDPLVGNGWEPIEPSESAPQGFPVIESFTRGSTPAIDVIATSEGRDYVLREGPVGNEGAFDCFWGDAMRGAASRYADQQGDVGEFGAAITAPVEQLVSDIIVHRDLDFARKPELFVFSQIFPHGRPTGGKDDPTLLPIRQTPVDLPGSPPLVNTALVPHYAQLVQKVYARMGWNADEFRGTRLVMEYPPLGSNVILRFALPAKP
jgi:hypothetical protein